MSTCTELGSPCPYTKSTQPSANPLEIPLQTHPEMMSDVPISQHIKLTIAHIKDNMSYKVACQEPPLRDVGLTAKKNGNS